MAKIRILIAEDSATLRKMTVMTLRNSGFEVLEAEDGLQALGLALSQKPDILLLDIQMPKLTGWEVCEKIREHPDAKTLPIVIFSTLNKAGDIKIAKRHKVAGYLAKPFSNENLISKISDALKYNPAEVLAKSDNQPPAEKPPEPPSKPAPKPVFPCEMVGDVAVLRFSGELDKPQMLNDSILKILKEDAKKILLELAAVTKVKAKSIIAVSRANKLANGLGGAVKVVLKNPGVINDFKIAEELDNLDYYASKEEALASFED